MIKSVKENGLNVSPVSHQLFVTADGSHSILVKELGEQYHSLHGAVQESRHVFIDAGLHAVKQQKKAVRMLEVGLGTGLNALLTLVESRKQHLMIQYTAVEAYPLPLEIIKQLNYPSIIGNALCADYFMHIHSCNWNETTQITPNFLLQKTNAKIQEYALDDIYDLIYFDAFAPLVQPELWTEQVFSKLYAVMSSGGSLVTYCAKGEVKRTLTKVGFAVQSLPGPPGKREMIRAKKCSINSSRWRRIEIKNSFNTFDNYSLKICSVNTGI